MQLMDHDEIPDEIARATSYIHGMKVASRVMVFYCISQGVAIILGGEDRFSADAYRTAVEVPGAPQTWGFSLLLFGFIAGLGVAREKDGWASLGMFLAGLWSALFGTAFLISALEFATANLTAVFTYALQSLLFMLAAVVFHSAHKRKRKRQG